MRSLFYLARKKYIVLTGIIQIDNENASERYAQKTHGQIPRRGRP